jgi:hypothetical protein
MAAPPLVSYHCFYGHYDESVFDMIENGEIHLSFDEKIEIGRLKQSPVSTTSLSILSSCTALIPFALQIKGRMVAILKNDEDASMLSRMINKGEAFKRRGLIPLFKEKFLERYEYAFGVVYTFSIKEWEKQGWVFNNKVQLVLIDHSIRDKVNDLPQDIKVIIMQ